MTNLKFYKDTSTLLAAFDKFCKANRCSKGCLAFTHYGCNCPQNFANLESPTQTKETTMTTNREKFKTTAEALEAFRNDPRYPTDFVQWLELPEAIKLPDWVKPGAMYYFPEFNSGARVYTIHRINYDTQKVWTEDNTFASFEYFTNGRCVQKTDLPDWVKVGTKFRHTTWNSAVFTVTRIDIPAKKVFTTPGTFSYFESFKNGDAQQCVELPSWVKEGARYIRTQYQQTSYKITMVDFQRQLITTQRETQSPCGPHTQSFAEFLTDCDEQIFLDVPDWVQLGAKFTCNLGCCHYTVVGFTPDTILVTGNGDSRKSWSQFKGPGAYVPEPDKPVLPDWVKLGVYYQYRDTKYTQVIGPFMVSKIKTESVEGTYVGYSKDPFINMPASTPFSKFINGEVFQVAKPVPIPEVYFDPSNNSINVVTPDGAEDINTFNVDKSDVDEDWVKLQQTK